MKLTEEQIAELAPDPASLKTGRRLASQTWHELGSSDRAAWGAMFGSGTKPYRLALDLRDLGYKCTCPSRIFPCKHVIGLMTLVATDRIGVGEEPEWVANWLTSRDARAAKKLEKTAVESEVPAPAAEEPEVDAQPAQEPKKKASKAKKPDKRTIRVQEGMATLKERLSDLIRVGLRTVEPKSKLWTEASKRLIDAQAPGVAAMLDEIGAIPRDASWEERVLGQMGRLALLTEAYEKIDALPEDFTEELRQTIGWPVAQARVLAEGERVTDGWLCLGSQTEREGRLCVKRTWFVGLKSARFALHLQFSPQRQVHFAEHFPPGRVRLEHHARYYPGVVKQRALWESEPDSRELMLKGRLPESATIEVSQVRERYATAMGVYPWTRRIPLVLRRVAVRPIDSDAFGALDGSCAAVPLTPGGYMEALVAETSTRPLDLFGEWNGKSFLPISLWNAGYCVDMPIYSQR